MSRLSEATAATAVAGPSGQHTDRLAEPFRAAMRRIASTVTLVTAADADGKPHGMAASAVISVSMAPPSMLVAVNRDAGIHPVLLASRSFCLNVLGREQLDLLAPFSSTALRERRFESGEWRRGFAGLPYLASAPAAIFCELDHVVEYGTHTLCIGQVRDLAFGASPEPLVWLDGAAR